MEADGKTGGFFALYDSGVEIYEVSESLASRISDAYDKAILDTASRSSPEASQELWDLAKDAGLLSK
jgi:hypothetical protein